MARRAAEASAPQGPPVTIQQLRVQGQQRFEEKSAALKRALSAHKQATTVNSHQSEWRQEHSRLTSSRQHAEADLLSAMQELATSAYSQHFHSAHVNVHQLAAEIAALLDDRRQAEISREQWAAQMSQPRLRARAMIAEGRAQSPARSTRLAAAQRAAQRTTLQASLHQLMHGLRHQSKVFGDELEQQRTEAEAAMAEYNSEWLARMSDDRIEDEASSPDALLVLNPHWLSSLVAERRAELDAARQRWSEHWMERRDMMERLFEHKRDHARQLLDERVAGLKRFGGSFDALLTEEQLEDEERSASTLPAASNPASHPNTITNTGSNAASSKRAAKSARPSPTVRHPWNSCDQRLLLHILTQYTTAGKQRKQTLDRLVLEFKHVTADELKLRLDAAIQQRMHAEQGRAIDRDRRLARWELDEAVESGWAAELAKLKDDWRRADEAQDREVERDARHADLQQLRAVKDEETRVKQETKEQEDKVQVEKDRRAEAEERVRREEVKKQLAQYEEQQRQEQEKVQRIIAAEQQREEEEKDELRREQAARLAVRQQLDAEKHKQQQLEAERLAEEQREKERRLEALRQSVAPQVAIDPQRVLAPTASSQAERDVDGRLFRVDGWSNEAVFTDPRAKLSAALHAAGIPVSGDYARQVIITMAAGREVRRDMQSTVQLSDGHDVG